MISTFPNSIAQKIHKMHLNGAKALAASETLAKLTTLNLYGNNIRDTGAQALAASKM